ncbi:hypothetical protein K7432_005015 [Basidiobolus ranarum]|uniref:Uncharacterized protein n=1 Tax=Basidiobolus ranarum TaxID=34480 RepID=A0ABR2W3R7_9FUNG
MEVTAVEVAENTVVVVDQAVTMEVMVVEVAENTVVAVVDQVATMEVMVVDQVVITEATAVEAAENTVVVDQAATIEAMVVEAVDQPINTRYNIIKMKKLYGFCIHIHKYLSKYISIGEIKLN